MADNKKQHPKIKGQLLAEFHGLQVYGSFRAAKKDGKNRVWLQVRQSSPKRYRVAESLSYMRSADIQFEETTKIKRFPRY